MTAWNREGVQWRQFRAVELVWLMHRYTYEAMKETRPNSVRKYLLESGDLVLLAQHDRGAFRDGTVD